MHQTSRRNVALYNWGTPLYDLLTTQEYWRQSIRHVIRQLRPLSSSSLKILDLGCGTGLSAFVLAEQLPRAEIIGIDIASRMIEMAQEHHRKRFCQLKNIHFQEADATELPFDDATFDIAIGHSFLYLVPQQLQVLREVNRVLKKGGQLVLMEPHAEGSLWRTLSRRSDYWAKLLKKPGATFRFIASIVGWRIFSTWKGQLSTPLIRQLFSHAGFDRIATLPTLDQLGVLCIGYA